MATYTVHLVMMRTTETQVILEASSEEEARTLALESYEDLMWVDVDSGQAEVVAVHAQSPSATRLAAAKPRTGTHG